MTVEASTAACSFLCSGAQHELAVQNNNFKGSLGAFVVQSSGHSAPFVKEKENGEK